MGSAIGAVLPLALGVALSPIPIIAVVLMLATPRGGVNGSSFLLGWLVGLSVVGTIVLLVSGGSGGSAPPMWVGVVSLLLGLALIVLAVLQWRRRPRGGTTALPGWMARIDRFSPLTSAGLGLVLSAANPKNLLITVGAAAAIAEAGISPGQQAVTLGLFVLLGTLGPGVPLAIYVGLGARSQRLLDGLRGWMAVHNTAIMCVLLVVIGLKLVGDGISTLAG